jgi:NADPH:quinone reductase-like Zn-dependent oxidoreductase
VDQIKSTKHKADYYETKIQMKRVQYHRYGGPEVMLLESFSLSAPGKDEVLVRVKAASVNPLDWKLRQGNMKLMTGWRFPRAMGSDFAGVIESVGGGVQQFKPGDDVIGSLPIKAGGAFGEQVIIRAALLVKKPAALSFEAAASLPIAGGTAWRALVLQAKMAPGQKLFINGAMGGVGQAAAAIAKWRNGSVAGRVGAEAIPVAEGAGLSPALDYTKPMPASQQHQYDIVLDCNGSLTSEQEAWLAKKSGIILDTNPAMPKVMRALTAGRRKIVFNSPSAKIRSEVVNLAAAGKLAIKVARTAPLDNAVELIRDVEAGQRLNGKAVILMP